MKFSNGKIKTLIFAASATLLSFSQSVSGTAIYSYQGKNFDYFSYSSSPLDVYPGNTFTGADSIQIKVTLENALPAFSGINLFGADTVFNNTVGPNDYSVLAWEISAGSLNFTSVDSPLMLTLYMGVDNLGSVHSWNFQLTEWAPAGTYPAGTIFAGADTYIKSAYYVGSSYGSDFAGSCNGDIDCLNAIGYPSGSTESPGTWSMTNAAEVPVSSTASLALLALGGLVFARRRHSA